MVKVKGTRCSPIVAHRNSAVRGSPRAKTSFKKVGPSLPRAKNILTKFAQCTEKNCCNRKQPGTSRCQWHNKWLYRAPADTMCALFEKSLSSLSTGSDDGDASAKKVTIEQLRDKVTRNLQESQTKLTAVLRKQHENLGLSFAWPDEGFVARRRAALGSFLQAVAREIVKPTGSLDISDAFAIDAVIERMYMVGLMNPKSPFKKFESDHMKNLISFFKVFSLGNADAITSEGVVQFINYMFDKKDRMVVDLLYTKQSHIKVLFEMLNNPPAAL